VERSAQFAQPASPEAMIDRPAPHTRPIWAEVSRRRLLHNYRLLEDHAGPDATLLAVIKADAYGHGLEGCARALAAAGVRDFGVTSVEEAVCLRSIVPAARILVMSGVCRGEADAVLEHKLTPAVWDPAHCDLLIEAAERHAAEPASIRIHLEIDTGMSRQGVQLKDLLRLLEWFGPASPLRIEAAMTHFHSPEDRAATAEQITRLTTALQILTQHGVRLKFLSAGSSADVLDRDSPEVSDLAAQHGARRMFRTGLALYGYSPSGQNGHDLQPVLSWKTKVLSLREIEAGTAVGYGATFRAERFTRLALLPVGYADGLSRALSNRGAVLIRGQRAPIAGRISMDQTMVDATDIRRIEVGDEAVLIGTQGSETITAADIATLTGTIAYEVLCDIGSRVPRVMAD
jgi:alanine racemase